MNIPCMLWSRLKNVEFHGDDGQIVQLKTIVSIDPRLCSDGRWRVIVRMHDLETAGSLAVGWTGRLVGHILDRDEHQAKPIEWGRLAVAGPLLVRARNNELAEGLVRLIEV